MKNNLVFICMIMLTKTPNDALIKVKIKEVVFFGIIATQFIFFNFYFLVSLLIKLVMG
jgi:hypothetical protein